MRLRLFACLVALAIGLAGAACAASLERRAGETDLAFAERVLSLPDDADAHVTDAWWNGVETLFVDYQTQGDYPERPIVALQRQADGGYRLVRVTLGEQEGGTPDVAAIGFAGAGAKAGKSLIVILTWPVRHYDVEGTLYEVRIFDPPSPGRAALELSAVSRKFGSGCDCSRRDDGTESFRFKTIAAVKAQLRKLGY